MKMLRFHLYCINAWPGKRIGDKHPKYMGFRIAALIIIMQCYLYAAIVYIFLHYDKSFYELGHMYITLIMGFVHMSRILFTTLPQSTKYRNLTVIFLTKMHLLFVKDESKYAMKTHKQIHFISHVFTLSLIAQMYGACALFNVIPIWNNYSSGKYKEGILYNRTYEHSLYISVPVIKSDTHFDAYVVVCIYNWIIACLCSLSLCMLDLLLSLIVFNIWGHFKILLNKLETFPLPGEVILSMDDRNASVYAEMYSKEESKVIFEKLKQCIDYHKLIKNFTDKMSEAFGPMCLIYYAFHQLSGCLLLLECSQMTTEALMRYLPLTFIVFQQLIQMSVIFELLGSTSGKLKDAVYGVPWQYMDTSNRKIVSIFLYNVQEPIHVKAMGIVDVGVTTMATILKTSLSYFTFLHSM